MRSFSDLIQFMQPKRSEPLPPVADKSDAKGSSVATNDSVASVTSEPIAHSESNLRSNVVLNDTGSVDNSAVQPVLKQDVVKQNDVNQNMDHVGEDSKIASEPAE